MLSPNITFKFNSKIDSKIKLEKLISTAYQANKKFFGKNPSKIKIIFLYQRLQMNKVCRRKTEKWEVGHAFIQNNTNYITIFSPTVFNKVSNHPKSDFSHILTHEIAHVFAHNLLGFYYPKWFDEGLAGFVAKQYKIRPVKYIHKFSKLHDKKGWNQYHNYAQAFSFVKYLFDKLTKKKMLQFLQKLSKTLDHHHCYKDFVWFFNEFFNTDFDQLVLDWKKKRCFRNFSEKNISFLDKFVCK